MTTSSHKKKSEKKPSRKAIKPVKKPTIPKSAKKKSTSSKRPSSSSSRSSSASPSSGKGAKSLSAFNPAEHELVPKHEKVSDKEAKKIRELYHVTLRELPKIYSKDPAIVGLGLKQGDIIKITRQSPTRGETVFYRGVIDE